jgi:hypothetical protein
LLYHNQKKKKPPIAMRGACSKNIINGCAKIVYIPDIARKKGKTYISPVKVLEFIVLLISVCT